MRKLLGIIVLSLSAMAVAHAHQNSNPPPQNFGGSQWSWAQSGAWTQTQWQSLENWASQFGNQFESWIEDQDPYHQGPGSGPVAAPELDPASAFAALTLLAGGLAVVRGRRGSKK